MPVDSVAAKSTEMTAKVQAFADFLNERVRPKIGEVFAQELQAKVDVIKASTDENGLPYAVFKVHTERWMRNGYDIVHGGAISTLLDFYTSLAVSADPKMWPKDEIDLQGMIAVAQQMGVSRSMSIQFLQATPLEQDIYISCTVMSNTSRNTYLSIKFFDSEGKLLAFGTHDKIRNKL